VLLIDAAYERAAEAAAPQHIEYQSVRESCGAASVLRSLESASPGLPARAARQGGGR
jgi:hypothetical protein